MEELSDDLDRILSAEDTLEPSSGFTMGTMRAIQEASEEPPPLPFPWTRLIVGFSACAALTALGVASVPPTVTAAVGPEYSYAAVTLLASVTLLRVMKLVAQFKAS